MIFRNNPMRFVTEPLIDGNGDPITTGTVTHDVISMNRATIYIVSAGMTHVGGTTDENGDPYAQGQWRRDTTSAETNGIPTTVRKVRSRAKIGSGSPPVGGEIERVELVQFREDITP